MDTVRNLVTFETDHLSLFALTDTSNHLVSGINDKSSSKPLAFELSQNYPNPFNPSTAIGYDLPQAGHVVLEVYNLAGQLVRRLVNGQTEAGHHRVGWDGRDDFGQTVASGIYLYRLTVDGGRFAAVRRMVFLK